MHKAIVLKVSDGLFRDTVREGAISHPEVELDEILIDAMAALLVRTPEAFDVVLTTNMFGDILSDEAAELSGGLGLGGGACIAIGERRGFTPQGAALVNGTLIHSLDFDDTHARASLHTSAPIVPAALAAAEMAGVDGEELVPAIIAGYEIQTRLSMALGPADHFDRGFHPTATCGVFVASAAAGKAGPSPMTAL